MNSSIVCIDPIKWTTIRKALNVEASCKVMALRSLGEITIYDYGPVFRGTCREPHHLT